MRNSISILFILIVFPLILTARGDSLNQVIEIRETGEHMLIGYVNTNGFEKLEDFHSQYVEEIHTYEADMSEVMPYQEEILESKITIILATWCPDTRKQLPRFMKIMDEMGYPQEDITMIAVDRELQAKGIEVKEKYDLKRVPTIIFRTREGKEYGRIVENPALGNTLETEIQYLFKTQEYDDARSETGEE
jgi:thiol-disulfide isomerase/thioredoxin